MRDVLKVIPSHTSINKSSRRVAKEFILSVCPCPQGHLPNTVLQELEITDVEAMGDEMFLSLHINER